MCNQVPTPGRRHVADGWSMVRSHRWLIGYTFHHQKSYVVPTLGQPYQPNMGRTLACQLRRSTNHTDHVPTLDQHWIKVVLLTGYKLTCNLMYMYVYLREHVTFRWYMMMSVLYTRPTHSVDCFYIANLYIMCSYSSMNVCMVSIKYQFIVFSLIRRCGWRFDHVISIKKT